MAGYDKSDASAVSVVSVKVVTPAGNTCAELDVPSDMLVGALKRLLVVPCQAPAELLQLLSEEVLLENSKHLSTYLADGMLRLTLSIVVTSVAYAFADGSSRCVTR